MSRRRAQTGCRQAATSPLARSGTWRRGSIVLAVLWAAMAGCSEEPGVIRVEAHRVVVQNRTSGEWTNVEVWINDHYRVTAPALAAKGTFEAPLDVFVAGFGQRFDPGRQAVRGVEVSAQTPVGTRVTLVWGEGRRR